jgi:peptidoglycan hydrolase-like protein with peptidoglycan-binding domain
MSTDTLGVDLASYEAGEDLARLTDIGFVIAKVTESNWYIDPPYDGWRTQAKAAGKLFVWYHFLVQGVSAAAQAAFTKAHVGDPSLPGMLDVETEGHSMPTLADVLAYIDAARALGLRIKLVYLPRWYWAKIGSPDLTPLTARGVYVVSSAYPRSAKAGAAATYAADGGDAGEGWAPYGGVTPLIWQFGDDAPEDGRPNDINAYRGTLAQLEQLLGAAVTQPSQPSGPRVLVQGDTGADVKALQVLLAAKGYPPGAADGNFGPLTKAAVVAFQRDHLAAVKFADGEYGPLTRAALEAAPAADPWPGVVLKKGSTGPLVKRVQARLNALGAAAGPVDGEYGDKTTAAVERFQRAHPACGAADGQVGPRTWPVLRP